MPAPRTPEQRAAHADYMRRWREKNREQRAAHADYMRRWREENREHNRRYMRDYMRERRATDPAYGQGHSAKLVAERAERRAKWLRIALRAAAEP